MKHPDGFEADLKRIVGDCQVVREHEGFMIVIDCAKCHHVHRVPSKNKMPPDAMNRKLTTNGWKTGRRMICPDCNRRETKMSIPAVATPVEPTPAAKRVHRTVMEALMLVYDEEKKGYNNGYSDKRVSDETGAALEYVRKTREDYFGPLREPGELAQFRMDLEQIREEHKTIMSNYLKANADLSAEIKKLSDKFDRMAKQNGWA